MLPLPVNYTSFDAEFKIFSEKKYFWVVLSKKILHTKKREQIKRFIISKLLLTTLRRTRSFAAPAHNSFQSHFLTSSGAEAERGLCGQGAVQGQ